MAAFNSIITDIAPLNVQRPNGMVVIHAKQSDGSSRFYRAEMYDGNEPWNPGDDGAIIKTIRYKKPDGHFGFYDTMEDGTPAVVVDPINNTVTFGMTEQSLNVAGRVIVDLSFYKSISVEHMQRISTFNFILDVEPAPISDNGIIDSKDYVSVLAKGFAAAAALIGMTVSASDAGSIDEGGTADVHVTGGPDEGTVYNFDFELPSGKRGLRGYRISQVIPDQVSLTPGGVDTYKFKTEDGSDVEGTFQVYNGMNGQGVVNSVDGVQPTGTNIQLNALRVPQGSDQVQALTTEQIAKIRKALGIGSMASYDYILPDGSGVTDNGIIFGDITESQYNALVSDVQDAKNRVASVEVGKMDSRSVVTEPIENSPALITSGGVYEALSEYTPSPSPGGQTDTVVTKDSTNLITSGAVYNATDSVVKTSETQPTEDLNRLWINPSVTEIEIPTMDDIDDLKSILDDEIYDALNVPWTASSSYPYGWRSGYYTGDVGSAFTSATSYNYMRAQYGVDLTRYPSLAGAKRLMFTPPTGYSLRVATIDSENIITAIDGAINTATDPSFIGKPITVEFNENRRYLISLGKFNGDAPSKAADNAFCETIKMVAMFSRVDDLENKFDSLPDQILAQTEAIDWANHGTASYPIGWRAGYYKADDGELASSLLYMCTPTNCPIIPSADGKLTVETPSGYYVSVNEYENDGTYIGQHGNSQSTPSVTISTVAGHRYHLNVGRFTGNVVAEYLTAEFVSTIIATITRPAGLKRDREAEFTFFPVSTNISPSAVGDSSTNLEGDTEKIVNAVVSLPYNYSASGAPTPLIMLCHGQSATVNAAEKKWFNNSTDFLNLLRAFTEAGYAVFDVGSTNPDDPALPFADWGNPALMGAYIKAWEFVKQNYNVEDRLYIYSESMGTQAALNMLKWYSGSIVTAINAAPRTSLSRNLTRTIEIGGYQIGDAIRLRYGFTGDTLPDRLIGYDNSAQIVSINNTDYVMHQFPPLKVLAGTDDDAADTLLQTRQYYTALRNTGNVVNYREIAGADHHAVCYLTPGDLKQECVDWFNRFRLQ